MRCIDIGPTEGFSVVGQTRRSQAATMVLESGEITGGPSNRHEDSDQWLYVVSGEGELMVEGARVPLRTGTLVLIEAGEKHEVRNTGDHRLETLNFYAPPEY